MTHDHEQHLFILPIEEDNPVRHTPWAVYTLMALNALVFAVLFFEDKSAIYRSDGFIPADPNLLDGLTSAFLHGSFWHLLGNMVFLWMFGDNVEDVIGPVFLTSCFLFCTYVSLLFYLPFNSDSEIPLVGASGAISGLIGMYWVFFPRARARLIFYVFRWKVGEVYTTVHAAVFAWFLEQALLGAALGVTSLDDHIPTAFLAHVGGFFAGVLIGYQFLNLGFVRRYAEKRKHSDLWGYVDLGA